MSRGVAEIKNSLASINKLPTETVVHIATFSAKERDLVDATAICYRWRKFLSSPQPLRNAGGSSSEIQAYIERSGSMLIVVDLSTPELAELIVPHTSRLVGLIVRVEDSLYCLSRIAEHLRHPVPTLQNFCISVSTPQLRQVEVRLEPPPCFLFIFEEARSRGNLLVPPTFDAPETTFKIFPHVTKLTLSANEHILMVTVDFLDTSTHFPILEMASITFTRSNWYWRLR